MKKLILYFSIFIFFSFCSVASDEFIIYPENLNVKIGLVLSGGGARGVSQIGVLKVFEKEGIDISCISGTSIGCFVGGLFAVGYTPKELEEIALTSNWSDILSLSGEQERTDFFFDQKLIKDRTLATLRFNKFKIVYPKAISQGWKFSSFIQKLVWKGAYLSENFDLLKVPFRPVATDLVTGKSISMSNGNLVTAMRASATIPLRNTPIENDSMVLVDGGLFANLPVETIKEFQPDVIIAVNTTSPLHNRTELNKPWALADQVVSILMRQFTDKSKSKADIVLEPQIGAHGNDNFTHLDSLIQKGEEATLRYLPNIKNLISLKKDSIVGVIGQEVFNYFKVFPFCINTINLERIEDSNIVQEFETCNCENPNPHTLKFSEFLKRVNKNDIDRIKLVRIENNNDKNTDSLGSNPNIRVIVEYYPILDSVVVNNQIREYQFEIDSIAKSFYGLPNNDFFRRKMIESIKKFYAKNGYSFVKVTTSDDKSNPKLLKLNIFPNIISKITFKNIQTSEFLVERELAIKVGDFTNVDKIVQSWSNLLSTDLFSDVQIDFKLDTLHSACEVIINAQERGTQILNLLARIDNERNLQGGADFIQINLFNIGLTSMVSVLGGNRNFLGKIGLSQTRIFESDFTFTIDGYYERWGTYNFVPKKNLSRNTYESIIESENISERYGLYAKVGTQIERFGNLFAGLRFERQRSFLKDELFKPDFYKLFSVRFALAFDNRNKADFSTDGRKIDIYLETSLFNFEKITQFTKAYFSQTINFSVKDVTFRSSITFGFADKGLPYSEYFSLGGQDSFFGFREDEFRGKQLVRGNFDVQYRLPFQIYFDTFISLSYGIGSIWKEFEVIRINELKHGIGFTIGFDTPIGPAKFSIGRAFYFVKNPNAVVWGPFQTYFSIGNKLF